MTIKQLLEITGIGNKIVIEGIKNRVRSNITEINCINEYGMHESWLMDEAIEKYGYLEVIHQNVNNDTLEILVRL